MNNNDKEWIKYIESILEDQNLDEKKVAYYERILRVYNMPDLSYIK
jgi:hypothetical protein